MKTVKGCCYPEQELHELEQRKVSNGRFLTSWCLLILAVNLVQIGVLLIRLCTDEGRTNLELSEVPEYGHSSYMLADHEILMF